MKKQIRLIMFLIFVVALTMIISVKLFPAVSEIETVSVYAALPVNEINISMKKTEDYLKQLKEEVEKRSLRKPPFEVVSIHPNMNIKSVTNFTESQFNIMLKGTPLFGHGRSFVKVEKEYGVNGLFMVALTGQEQGFGTGEIARLKNNLTSYMAFDENENMAYSFRSYEHCLLVTADLLIDDYLTENGKYYNGNTVAAINVKYASDQKWAGKILQIMKRLQDKLLAEYSIGI